MATGPARRPSAVVRDIQSFYHAGRAVARPAGRDPKRNAAALAAAGKRVGLTPNMARLARQFADPAKGYTDREVEALCREVRAAARLPVPPASWAFGRTHLVRLMTVPRADRPALQREAIRGGWSTAVLEDAIAARYPRRPRAGGRRPRLPAGDTGLLVRVERWCEGWARMLAGAREAARAKARSWKPGERGEFGPLPPAVEQLIRAADATLKHLKDAAAAELPERRPGPVGPHPTSDQ